MRRPWPLLVSLLVLAAACAVLVLVYQVSDSMCRERGGHTELVYGGRGGWVCDGADR